MLLGALEYFAANIFLILAMFLALFVAAGILLMIWVAAKTLLRHYRVRQAFLEHYRSTHFPDGRPLPPTSRGLCHRCLNVFDEVFHLCDGTKLCRACFDVLHQRELRRTIRD